MKLFKLKGETTFLITYLLSTQVSHSSFESNFQAFANTLSINEVEDEELRDDCELDVFETVDYRLGSQIARHVLMDELLGHLTLPRLLHTVLRNHQLEARLQSDD